MSGDPSQGDDLSTLELQVGLEEIERSDGRESARWLGFAAAVLVGGTLAPVAPVLGAFALVAATLVATAMGFFRVRRRQRRESIERELAGRRADDLQGAETKAGQLVALHDELDRLESQPTRVREVVLLGAAAVLLIPLGLAEGVLWASSAGVFSALAGALSYQTVADRRQQRRALEHEIADLQSSRSE